MARKKTPKKRKKKSEKVQMPSIMPTRKGDEKLLIAFVDVSGKSDAEIAACHRQVNSYSPGKVTFALRTMRYEGDQLAKIDEADYPPKAASSPLKEPCCPKCGEKASALHGIAIMETYHAANPVEWDADAQTIKVMSVWHNTENFSDGDSDYTMSCLKCGYKTTKLDEFGLISGEWDWG